MKTYTERVTALEADGLTTSDAQGVVDVELHRADHESAHKTGFVDGCLSRECKSPWANLGYTTAKRNAQYVSGYMDGEEAARRHGLAAASTLKYNN